MSQSPCPVCGRPDCGQHADAKIVRLAPALVARLVSAPHSNIWTRYQIDPADEFGLVPLTLYANPVGAPPAGTFWVKEVETRKGDVHHASVYLVQVDGNGSTPVLYLHEAVESFATDRRQTLAAGHSQAGFFALTTSSLPPAIAGRNIVFGQVLDVSELDALPDWQPGRFGGVIRQTAIANRDMPRPGATIAIYDHRPEPTPTAFVAVTEKTADSRRWFHLDLYPDDDPAIGRVAIGSLHLHPAPGEVCEWLFHSTSTDPAQRLQAVTVVAIFTAGDDTLPLDLAAIRQKCESLAAANAAPAVLCDALEDLVLVRVNAGELQVDDAQEAAWGRIASMRSRAERTDFAGEAFVAWKKAVFALSKMAAFPFGQFDAYIGWLETQFPTAPEAADEPA